MFKVDFMSISIKNYWEKKIVIFLHMKDVINDEGTFNLEQFIDKIQ